MLEGQLSIFELDEREENKKESCIDFSIDQLKTIERLKEKYEWIEYSLYDSGVVVFIIKKDINLKVIPQENIDAAYSLMDKHLSYFFNEDGEVERGCSLGIVRWQDPIKTIINN